MSYTLHVRLIDKQNQLLGWTQVSARARGDGQLWTEEPVLAAVEVAGMLDVISVHWVDVNVEIRAGVPEPVHLAPGKIFLIFEAGPIFRVGPQAGGLPPIVLNTPVRVSLPLGGAMLSGVPL